MTLKTRIERLESVHGDTAEPIPMTDGFIECNSIEEWLEICRAIDAEYKTVSSGKVEP
ncbi:hypothetical protein [Desulfatirhabdium butyrativorans]|uniref:hypothetical protein n=1 Tax=Desulfatirhabdium butyrativorans TaxID=340467 RepID=UPI0012EC059B|nr:hypothetical protein [Desulfatirhabdium butyrativorans]